VKMTTYLDRAQKLSGDAVSLRRELHQHPELGFKEFETANRIAFELEKYSIPFKKGIAGTGLIGTIQGKSEFPTGMIRVDMDALPIQEQTSLPFVSLNPGVMHACGHDGHMAMGVLAARLLMENANSLEGSIRCLFQPA